LASLPPEVDVPLPLRLGFIELPVVGEVPGVAEPAIICEAAITTAPAGRVARRLATIMEGSQPV
jgi:hypothetical protein